MTESPLDLGEDELAEIILDRLKHEPGTITGKQQQAILDACPGMERPARLATISDIVGRQVTSSNELSYTEAAQVLGKLSAVRP